MEKAERLEWFIPLVNIPVSFFQELSGFSVPHGDQNTTPRFMPCDAKSSRVGSMLTFSNRANDTNPQSQCSNHQKDPSGKSTRCHEGFLRAIHSP